MPAWMGPSSGRCDHFTGKRKGSKSKRKSSAGGGCRRVRLSPVIIFSWNAVSQSRTPALQEEGEEKLLKDNNCNCNEKTARRERIDGWPLAAPLTIGTDVRLPSSLSIGAIPLRTFLTLIYMRRTIVIPLRERWKVRAAHCHCERERENHTIPLTQRGGALEVQPGGAGSRACENA